jgi:hypothetical protein
MTTIADASLPLRADQEWLTELDSYDPALPKRSAAAALRRSAAGCV